LPTRLLPDVAVLVGTHEPHSSVYDSLCEPYLPGLQLSKPACLR